MSSSPEQPVPAQVDVPDTWRGLLDDAGGLAAEANPLDAVAAHDAARAGAYGLLLGSLLVPEVALPLLRGTAHPLHVVLTGGAGQVSGPAGLASRTGLSLAGLEVQLRDVDDLAGNVRRVIAAVHAAQDEGVLDEDVPVHVEFPVDAASLHRGAPTGSWLRAADEAAAAELRLTLRVGAPEADLVPSADAVAGWIDSSLDREMTFRVTAGSDRPVTATAEHGGPSYGFANLLLATRRAFDGATRTEVVETLAAADATTVGAWVREEEYLASTRRWCRGVAPLTDGDPAHSLERAYEGLRATLEV